MAADVVQPTLVAAPLGRRLIAFMVDGIIAFVIALVVYVAFGEEVFTANRDLRSPAFAAIVAIGLAYSVGPVVFWGGTPGKLLMGLYISDERGQRVSVFRASVRLLVSANLYISYIFQSSEFISWYIDLTVYLVSLVMLLADTKKRRALHDRIAGTRVLRGRAVPRDTQRSFQAI